MRELTLEEMSLVSGGWGCLYRRSCQPQPVCEPKPPCGGVVVPPDDGV
jgi:hypothetical protein